MATTDQPQEPEFGTGAAATSPTAETAPLAPASVDTAYPPGPPPIQSPAAPAATPGSGGRIAIIVGSVVGGLLLIALAFGGGTAVGWVLGSHHAGFVAAGDHHRPGGAMPGPGQGDRGQDQHGPGQRPDDRPGRDAHDDVVTPSPNS